jgi:hypothetical protein
MTAGRDERPSDELWDVWGKYIWGARASPRCTQMDKLWDLGLYDGNERGRVIEMVRHLVYHAERCGKCTAKAVAHRLKGGKP